MFKSVAALSGLALLSACASQPEDIQATYVSPNLYANYSCSELLEERERIVAKVNAASAAQSDKATNDAVATGVGLILFWPAIFFLAAGSDREAELASLKGNYDAIEQATIKRKCRLESPSGVTAQADVTPVTASVVATDDSFEAQQRSISGQSAASATQPVVEAQPVAMAAAPAVETPAPVKPQPALVKPAPAAQPVQQPAPVAASAASPSIPAALYDDPNLAAPVEYSRSEIRGYCGQAWRIRDLTDGTFEINPCYDRRYN